MTTWLLHKIGAFFALYSDVEFELWAENPPTEMIVEVENNPVARVSKGEFAKKMLLKEVFRNKVWPSRYEEITGKLYTGGEA